MLCTISASYWLEQHLALLSARLLSPAQSHRAVEPAFTMAKFGTIPAQRLLLGILKPLLTNTQILPDMLAAGHEGGEPMVFGFGKRASNSPSASSNSGGDDTYRQQPPHIRRLIDAMQTIFDDTSKLAQAIRQGSSLPSSTPAEPNFSPIRCSASETLFEHANDNGEKLYSTYHFTADFKTINPAAQYFLHVMYGRIYVANVLADKLCHGSLSDDELVTLKDAIDATLATSAYYIYYFRGYALSAAILMNRLSGEDLQKRLNEHGSDWVRKLETAKAAMFRPERLIELVPDRKPRFVLAASGPYQEGQKVINGVYFAPEHAEALLKSMAAAQAEALNARGH